jgi:hypothetical protein
MLVVKPGAVAPHRSLLEVLRDAHDSRRERWRLDRDFREAQGIPLTEEAGDPEPDPGPFEEPSGLPGGVTMAPRMLSVLERDDLLAACRAAYSSGDAAQARAAERALLSRAVAEVGGLRGGSGEPLTLALDGEDAEAHLDAFEMAGLLPWLFAAAVFLQRLPSGKAWRSGVRPPST